MLCQKCHKNLATVRYAEVIDGKVTDLHLCPDCLREQQAATGDGFTISSRGPSAKGTRSAETAGASGSTSASATDEPRRKGRRSCPACGTGLKRAIETGAVGCVGCFEVFADEIEPLLMGLHGSTQHRGKAPRIDDVRAQVRDSLQTKRALLRTALDREDYEEAALLRDGIRGLQSKLTALDSRQDVN